MIKHAFFLCLLASVFMGEKTIKSDREWKKILTIERYQSLREKKQDKAYLNQYANSCQEGTYFCAGCQNPLFSSKDKILTITSYPNFSKPIYQESIYFEMDTRFGFKRYEVLCRRCDGHLGHIFKENQRFRYCINSSSLILNF